ncbi:MAG: SMP-30/gluconolactonase/LRE family protein [Pseudomonadota bacterium]
MRLLAALLLLALSGGMARAETWAASYPEGPLWQGGALYWAEMTAHRIMRWQGRGKPVPFVEREGCGPTAIAPYRGGFIVLCHLEGALAQVDRTGRVLRMIRQDKDGNRLRNPNDASTDARGGVWFTDPGRFSARAPAEGALYYFSSDGTLTRHITGLHYGNGVHVDRAGGRLLLSEHLARRVLSYPITDEGLGAPEVLIDDATLQLDRTGYAEAGPDGLEIGPDGCLWVAMYGAGYVLSFGGDRIEGHGTPTTLRFITNVAFGRAVGGGYRLALTGATSNTVPPFPGKVVVLSIEPGDLEPCS